MKTRPFFFLMHPLLIVCLALSACFNPLDTGKGGEGTIVLNLPARNSYTAQAVPAAEAPSRALTGYPAQLRYEIVFSGPGGQTLTRSSDGGGSISVIVAPGLWNVSVKAFGPDTSEVEALGENDVNVKPGQDNHVEILMRLAAASAIDSYLVEAEGGTQADPANLRLAIQLTDANWTGILNALEAAGKYVNLDLSAGTRSDANTGGGLHSDGGFDARPSSGANTGKSYVVSITLPEAAGSIVNGAGSTTFGDFTNLKQINLGNGIRAIGSDAFTNLDITGVNWGSVETIGDNAFSGNSLGSVTIPNRVTSIGANAFDNAGLSGVVLPTNPEFTSIPAAAFSNNFLTSVTIPNTVTSIGQSAFQNNQLTYIIIPPAVNTIEALAFQSNPSLNRVVIGASVNVIADALPNNFNTTYNIAKRAGTYTWDGAQWSRGEDVLAGVDDIVPYLTGRAGGDTAGTPIDLILPGSFQLNDATWTGILNALNTAGKYVNLDLRACTRSDVNEGYGLRNNGTFAPSSTVSTGKSYIVALTFPDAADIIGNGTLSVSTFQYFRNLRQIDTGSGVRTIGAYAFYNISMMPAKLATVILGNNVETIEHHAFCYANISNITWGAKVKTIGEYAFSVNALTSVVIPETVTSIGQRAFEGNKLTSATIPSHFRNIGGYLFYNNQLTSVTFPLNLETIGLYTFAKNKLTSVDIPNTVISIGERSFEDNQLTSIVIPDSVRTINPYAFTGNQLTSITIGAGVTFYNGAYYPMFDNGFDAAYHAAGRAAGTYLWYAEAGVWSTTPPTPSGTVTITSNAAATNYNKFYQGVMLTANTAGVTGGAGSPTAYEWRRNGTAISGAAGNTYTVTAADKEAEISVAVTYTNGSLTSGSVIIHGGTPISSLSGMTQTGNYILTSDITVTAPKSFNVSDYFNGKFDGNGHTITLDIEEDSLSEVGLFNGIDSSGEVRNLRLTGSIAVPSVGALSVGVVAGENNGLIENVSSSVSITVNDNSYSVYAGGIAGDTNSGGKIQNCYSTGGLTIDGRFTVQAGGIIGNLGGTGGGDNAAQIEYCWASGDVSTSNASTRQSVGGITGVAHSGNIITNCAALNTVLETNGSATDLELGRIAGYDAAYSGGYSGVTGNYANSDLPSAMPTVGNDGTGVSLSATEAAGGGWWTGTINWLSVWGGASETTPWKWPASGGRPILFFEQTVNQ